jgi:hypothetical protein
MSAVAEVEMSSQPLPDAIGILNGKYVVGSNESLLIFKTPSGELRMISMEMLDSICQVDAETSEQRNQQLYDASSKWCVIAPE